MKYVNLIVVIYQQLYVGKCVKYFQEGILNNTLIFSFSLYFISWHIQENQVIMNNPSTV